MLSALYDRGGDLDDRFAERLVEAWIKLTNKKVRKPWPFGVLQAFRKGSFYDSSPLRKYLTAIVDGDALWDSTIDGYIAAVDVTSGDLEHVALTGHYRERNPVDWIMRSAAFPLGLSVEKDPSGHLYLDGGLREISAADVLVDAGCTAIYVFHCTPAGLSVYDEGTRMDRLGMRCLSILTDEVRKNDLARLKATCHAKGIALKEFFPETSFGDSLDFDEDLNRRRIVYGQSYMRRVMHSEGILKHRPHVVSGVSVGAVNAAAICMWGRSADTSV